MLPVFLRQVLALGERRSSRPRASRDATHHEGISGDWQSTFFQDANYHNQIVNERLTETTIDTITHRVAFGSREPALSRWLRPAARQETLSEGKGGVKQIARKPAEERFFAAERPSVSGMLTR
jgi:hypothetical protein